MGWSHLLAAPTLSATNHWAFQPLTRPKVPVVNHPGWAANPIDFFILARLEKEGLAPMPPAGRETWIRRVNYDLTGLPPSPEETASFLGEARPDAASRLVDRLLNSPRYGERWARHWLDVVRFAESHGFEMNQPRPQAWPYRDYVILAFNQDRPYDQFILDQLSGDTTGQQEATGFLVGGPWDQVKSPDPVLTAQQRAEELHDIVSTTSSTFLGLTVGCARCHDHKFDPIPQRDYYSFKAVFEGVQHGEREMPPLDAGKREQEAGKLREKLRANEQERSRYEPAARLGRTWWIDDEGKAPAVEELSPPKGQAMHLAGNDRGQLNDPGSAALFPNLGRSYHWWEGVSNRNLFAWALPQVGQYRLWISWGCGWNTHARDAGYFLDADGNLETSEDQKPVATIDQRKFADGSGDLPNQSLWSGFYFAGTFSLNGSNRLVLRAGQTTAPVTADAILLEEVLPLDQAEAELIPHLRVAVNRGENRDIFAPVAARFLRFTIFETTQLEPCLDELEIFSIAQPGANLALASSGAKAFASSTLPGNDIHRLEHLNDGRYGNDWSWISNERGKGWVQIELPAVIEIDRVVWSRDRDKVPRYEDRTPTRYQIEVSLDGQSWRRVASSDDRLPHGRPVNPREILVRRGLNETERDRLQTLAREAREQRSQLTKLTDYPKVYAGKFTEPGATRRFFRGDPTQPREEIKPGRLTWISNQNKELEGEQKPAMEKERRLALARWIADAAHPLTARVMVNRLWHYHFGRGLVETPSDFGLNGARPSHPELLDWLASELVARDWSLKQLQALIVNSSTYRQGGLNARGQAEVRALEKDSDNRLLWHFPLRRLSAEELRDTILTLSEKLDGRMGGPGFDLFEPNDNYVRVFQSKSEPGPETWRRMVYQMKPRMQLDDVFGAFDCPDAGQIAPRRSSSITALQALNLLNSPFLLQQSRFLAERLGKEKAEDQRIERAFQLCFNRPPSNQEKSEARELVKEEGWILFCRALLNANEFVFVE